jgi:hypothetical protein
VEDETISSGNRETENFKRRVITVDWICQITETSSSDHVREMASNNHGPEMPSNGNSE